MKNFIVGFSIFCILCTLIPFVRVGHWWIRMFDFPHIQVTILTTVAIILLMIFIQWKDWSDILLLGILSLVFFYQLYIIFPYTSISPTQVLQTQHPDQSNSISILSSNVLIDNRSSEKLKDLLEEKNPDIVVLLEPDVWWGKEMEYLKEEYPYFIEEPLDNAYGILFYSKLELVQPKLQYLIKEGIPSISTKVKLRSGKIIDLFCLHPEPPAPQENDKSDARDAELLLVAKEHIGKSRPTVVVGDLNDVAWSRTTKLFQKISELLDPRIGRGTFSTFHADYPILRWPLDHVFHSNHFQLIEMARLPHVGSDHFPIYISLEYDKSAKYIQEEPSADAEEKKEAQETIEKIQ